MENYFLIDYENVGADGLNGCDQLTKNDHIVIFFTENAKKIDMRVIAKNKRSRMEMIEVPAGKQSADIHIGSYFGYLAGNCDPKEISVTVISNDTDFDNLIRFWREREGIKADRAKQIKPSPKKSEGKQTSKKAESKQTPKKNEGKQSAKKNEGKTSPKKDENKESLKKDEGKQSSKKNESKADENKKSLSRSARDRIRKEIKKAIKDAGIDEKLGGDVAQVVTGLYGEPLLMSEVHNALMIKFPNYREIYEAIRPLLSKYAGACEPAPAQKKTPVNAEILQMLSDAGYDDATADYVASTVGKNTGVKNHKQQIYLAIISKYGMNKGLEIYNHIKKSIQKL